MQMTNLGHDTGGIWTREQALEVVSPGALRRLLRHEWRTLLPGVYCDAEVQPSATQRAWAAELASGGLRQTPERWRAVAMGRTAARVWGIPLIDDDDPAVGALDHVLDEVAVRSKQQDLVVRQPVGPPRRLSRHQPVFGPGDVVSWPGGPLLTSRLRTLFDCRLLLTHEALVCAIDAMLRAGHVSGDQLTAYAERHKGDRGAPAFRAALEVADGRAESPHETLTRLLLLPVLPALVPQVRLRTAGGRVLARFDLADETARFAVESDGRAGHAGSQMVARDRRRDRVTWQHGWWTERVTWFEVRREPARTRAWVVAQHREQSARRAA